MDRVVAARKLIGDLVKAEQIEVRRVEIVGRDLAKLIETLERPPSGQELGEWLEEHQQVTDLSASTAVLEELINRHLVDHSVAATATAARNPELERQVREDPANVASYQVYADWLQEHSDPLGELIALGVAAANGNETDLGRFERHLKRYEAYFVGESAAELATRVQLHWRFGFVQSIEAIGDLTVPVWQRLLGLRICSLVESIVLRRLVNHTVEAAIADAAPDSLRELTLESHTGVLPTHLLARPLRSLAVRGSYPLPLDATTFPASLDRLELHVPRLTSVIPVELWVRDLEVAATAPNIEYLIQAKLPKLERLTLDLGGASAMTVLDLVETLRTPALGHFGLRNGELDLATFRKLATFPISAELRSLGLTNLGLTDESIGPIAGIRGFSSLEQVDVGFNELTREGLETARELARTVISTRQLRRGSGMEKRVRRFAGSRLQAAEEIADPAAWKRAGIDGDIRWARYRGEADYELFISADLSRYGCSCPSSIQPCKHVVALALIAERTPLSPAPSHGVETRIATRGGLDGLLLASIDLDANEE